MANLNNENCYLYIHPQHVSTTLTYSDFLRFAQKQPSSYCFFSSTLLHMCRPLVSENMVQITILSKNIYTYHQLFTISIIQNIKMHQMCQEKDHMSQLEYRIRFQNGSNSKN